MLTHVHTDTHIHSHSHIISLCQNRTFITPDKIPAAECCDKHACGHMGRVASDYFSGDDDEILVSAAGVILGVTLVPAGLSQFCTDTLNPVQ